jgi:hypothetical protein
MIPKIFDQSSLRWSGSPKTAVHIHMNCALYKATVCISQSLWPVYCSWKSWELESKANEVAIWTYSGIYIIIDALGT